MAFIPLIILAIEDDDDRTFITHLYLKYGKLMYAVALDIVREHQAAEDMVSAAITEMIERIELLREIKSCRLRSYIASIVRNDSIDFVRKRDRQGKHTFLPSDESFLDNIASESAVDDNILMQAEVETLRIGLERLSISERLLLTMKYLEDKSDKEIGAVLHIGTDSVRTYLSRARKHLQLLVKEVDEHG